MADTQARFIDVDELRVGLYIYLDLGWMGHPFALNNFKIDSESQIETIRGLGLRRLRWSPELSDPPTPANPETPVATPAVPLSPAEQQRRLLLDQQASLARCEREFADATRAFREILKLAPAQPELARERARAMAEGLVRGLLDQGESCIRLLSEQAGEQTSLHAINVSVIALLLGQRLGLDAAALDQLALGALLHDIGKVALPERLRWRDAVVSAAERKLFQRHVEHGVALAARMGLDPEISVIIAQHHEYADGSGFPQRLRGEELTYLSRIVTLVNHYDILCNPSNPVAAITPHQALSLMFAQSRDKFDADILAVFIRMMGVYPPGSVVVLSDGRHALVVSVNAARPLKPRVIVHDSRVARDEALVIDLDKEPELGIRQSLKPLQLPRAVFDYLLPRQRICYFFERARESMDRTQVP
ncbi:HD-GYP domain-containing protein [Allochromatium vinosum]|uniref:HD-GYP domain-containing protein n=1 Tax=Allochromatium vinosum TaxID=1049 RepID=UPI0019080F14|nr:HD domain-containing phosphohydrolase [Allochromatium vinosum]MBK1655454.1 phosphohydrolase [Allochromatium vinosum]